MPPASLRRRDFLARAAVGGMLVVLPELAKAAPPRPLAVRDFRVVAQGIESPEGIALLPDGRLLFGSGEGTVGVIGADGRTQVLARAIAPNGVAVDAKGRAVIANMGRLKGLPGPLQRIDLAAGAVETLVSELEGRMLTSSNDLAIAQDGTIYCTHTGWGPAGRIGALEAEGFVYRYRPDGGADIVARGLRSPNGIRVSPDGRHLYVSLTAEARVVRWPILQDGTLGRKAYFGPSLGATDPAHTVAGLRAMPAAQRSGLGYCDGIAFDRAGNLWITLPLANRIVALSAGGERRPIVHDPDGTRIDFPTNLCWSGPGLKTLNVVSRKGGRIVAADLT